MRLTSSSASSHQCSIFFFPGPPPLVLFLLRWPLPRGRCRLRVGQCGGYLLLGTALTECGAGCHAGVARCEAVLRIPSVAHSRVEWRRQICRGHARHLDVRRGHGRFLHRHTTHTSHKYSAEQVAAVCQVLLERYRLVHLKLFQWNVCTVHYDAIGAPPLFILFSLHVLIKLLDFTIATDA